MIEDIIKLGMLILVIAFSFFSSRWILKAVYRSAGLTKDDVFSYRASVSRSNHPGHRLNRWIIQRSIDPVSTRKYLDLYTLATTTGALYAPLTFIAIIVDGAAFLKVHIGIGIALLLFYVVLIVFGNRDKSVNGDSCSFKSDAKDYIDFVKKETKCEIEDAGTGKKSLFVGIIQLLLFVALMVFVVVSINRCTNSPMESTSYSSVWDALVVQECRPSDTLEKYREQWDDNGEEKKLLNALVAQNNGYNVEYFEFLEDTYAKNIMSQSIESFRGKEGYDEDREVIESRANYNIYVYSNEETVVKIYRVDKTLLFVSYPKDKKPIVDEFLIEIGYNER